jgi:hypothetical protein
MLLESRLDTLSTAEVRDLGRLISEDFLAGRFDLSARPGAPPVSWASMPEFVAERRLRAMGASPVDVRVFITLMAAMDRARDADRLWRNGATLFTEDRWAFDPTACTRRSSSDVRKVLARTGVSQRHGPDSAAWRVIAEALADEGSPFAVRRAVFEGFGDAEELLATVRAARPSGQRWYPFLSGPKISEMWVRMLAAPGEAKIARLEHLNVAVDVQVRKVTEYLGVTDTRGRSLENARPIIQQTWRVAAEAVAGPPAIAGTVAGLDPALWFLAKWGCTFCERAHRRMPVSRACVGCRLPEG